LNGELLDGLTFSAFPCRFEFFLTEFGVERFVKRLNTVTVPETYYGLARAAFVTTGFLGFLRAVFGPIVSSFHGDRRHASIGHLSLEIKERWRDNLSEVPLIVIAVLAKAKDAPRVLSKSLFEIALTEEAAPLYGLVPFNEKLPRSVVPALKQLLTVDGASPMLDDLVHMITHTATASAPIFRKEHRQAVPVLFATVLMSAIDEACFSALPIGGCPFITDTYSLALHQVPVEGDDSLLEGRETTMAAVNTRIEASLRHLLQAADPIPDFKEIPDGLDLEEFFVRYLWKRGRRATIARRRDLVRSLQVTMKPFCEATVMNALRRVTIERKHELRILSLFTEIIETLAGMDDRGQESIASVEKVLYYTTLKGFWNTHQAKKKPFVKYIAQPALLTEGYTAVMTALAASGEPCASSKYRAELVYGFLSADFVMEDFFTERSSLAMYDVKISQALTVPQKFIAKQFPVVQAAVPGKFNKQLWMAEQAVRMSERQDLLDIFRIAAMEPNPMCKLRQMATGLHCARTFFTQNCPPTTELGADEFTPIMIAYVIFANPPFLLSNLVYIIDFCNSQDYGTLFESLIVHPMTVIKVIVNEVIPDLELASVVRVPLHGLE
jgi:hypothetical protein